MKLMIVSVLMNLFLFSFKQEPDNLQQIRVLYYAAAESEESTNKFYAEVKDFGENIPLKLGYKAMAQFMLCNHGINPFTKLSYFKKGKLNLERAIELDKDNSELRFLRFTIQTNVPSFLGYSEEIEKDKLFLLLSLQTIKDNDLFDRIVEYMQASEYCTVRDKEVLKKLKNGRGNIGRF